MFPDLAMIVAETIRIGLRFRKQQQARVFVSVSRNHHDPGGLEVTVDTADGAAAAPGRAEGRTLPVRPGGSLGPPDGRGRNLSNGLG